MGTEITRETGQDGAWEPRSRVAQQAGADADVVAAVAQRDAHVLGLRRERGWHAPEFKAQGEAPRPAPAA